jgi:uncharacterized membrane protein (DUF4010 family)
VSEPLSPDRLALLLGLSFFFGLADEEFYGRNAAPSRPGGIRTFPLLALAGAGFYLIEPAHGGVFAAGLLVLGAWLHAYYRWQIGDTPPGGTLTAELIIPACNLLAYLLGPIVLLQPSWVAIAFTVIAVLLLGARERLHDLAQRIPEGETATAGKFLILSGIVLPLLPNQPVSTLTMITPYQVWLAVVAVGTLSYGSYLVQRYVWPKRGIWVAAVLGGLYSSTATTVMLARRAVEQDVPCGALQAGIVLATALMYFRLLIVVAVLNLPLARALAVPLAALCGLALLATLVCRSLSGPDTASADLAALAPRNPLELTAAVIFAVAFVLVSLATSWARATFGQDGVFWLAAIVGVGDIDPFVLSLAQGGGSGLPASDLVAAILIAASSNNMLKAAYCLSFAGWRVAYAPALALVMLALAGGLAAALLR